MGSKKKASEKNTDKLHSSSPAFSSLSLSLSPTSPDSKKIHRAANAVRAAREKERLAARKARATES